MSVLMMDIINPSDEMSLQRFRDVDKRAIILLVLKVLGLQTPKGSLPHRKSDCLLEFFRVYSYTPSL
ncbi:hypothetical protein CEXT_32511 [Caerostris extrusa]|uniref:Uncharacterized protein n=1 Tax=Caerostris extrusa TaxID=172846 RepID=A0AAV4V995_CAEEX|nr:hypothetical protein CEXT_32511 [Caerostris extrusa]